MKEFPIARLVFDEQLWPRVRRDDERVEQLAALLADGVTLPPVKIQKGSAVVLGGWHTAAAYQRLKRETLPVEVVAVEDVERLLYAYREDADAALPYSAADVRSVARRLYQQRSNGHGANVVQLARDLGRARQTVESWIADLIEAERVREVLDRNARALAVHAFLKGAQCKQVRAAKLLGISQPTVNIINAESGTVNNYLNDSRIVSAAQSLIHLALGNGATREEVKLANDWILAQTQPELLAGNRAHRLLTQCESDLMREESSA